MGEKGAEMEVPFQFMRSILSSVDFSLAPVVLSGAQILDDDTLALVASMWPNVVPRVGFGYSGLERQGVEQVCSVRKASRVS